MGSWAQGTCPGAPREQGGWEGRTQVRPGSVLGTLLGPWPQPLRPLAMDSTVPDLFPKPRTSLLTPVVSGAPKSSLHSPPATSPSLHQLPPPLTGAKTAWVAKRCRPSSPMPGRHGAVKLQNSISKSKVSFRAPQISSAVRQPCSPKNIIFPVNPRGICKVFFEKLMSITHFATKRWWPVPYLLPSVGPRVTLSLFSVGPDHRLT